MDKRETSNQEVTTSITTSTSKNNSSSSNNNKNKKDDDLVPPTIYSLKDLQITIPNDIREHLSQQYEAEFKGTAREHLDDILQSMKLPPKTSICRVNLIQGSRESIQQELIEELKKNELEHFMVTPHPVLSDILCVDLKDAYYSTDNDSGATASSSSLAMKGPAQTPDRPSIFGKWPKRIKFGWPMTHQVVVVDRFCGEAVLRGSNIFVKGILSADVGIQKGDSVAVYADLGPSCSNTNKKAKIPRGTLLEQYTGRRCVYLGLGTACFKRADMFRLDTGVGIIMSPHPEERPGPLLPPISGLLPSKLYFQNLPSAFVAHALDPQPGEVIIDMCSAPGGKTSHLASLVRNNATIVACDKSRKKMVAVKAAMEEMGISCIYPLALNTTECVATDEEINSDGIRRWKSVQKVLEAAKAGEDGLLNVSKFYPESFDRVLLDPPCSALGLRPKLQIVHTTLKELQRVSLYQRKFVQQAVALLKPGGIMTYSTCTFHADENERMVRYILDQYPELELVPVLPSLNAVGRPGLKGMRLSEIECSYVRRFDPVPSNPDCDTIGFFLAKFKKKG